LRHHGSPSKPLLGWRCKKKRERRAEGQIRRSGTLNSRVGFATATRHQKLRDRDLVAILEQYKLYGFAEMEVEAQHR
jgi:hypothetical protein